MSDPKRLASSSESDFERLLLRAGRTGAPPDAKERALAAAAAAAVAASGAAAVGLAAGKGAAVGVAKGISLLTWVSVVGVVSVGAVAGGVIVEHSRRAAAPAPTTSAIHAPAVVAQRPALPAVQAPQLDIPPVPDPAPELVAPPALAPPVDVPNASLAHTSAPRPSASGSSLPDELAMLQDARQALAAGQPALALARLDQYAARFPNGTMTPEANVVRIEALLAAGDRPSAERVAQAFLARDPESPYASRVRSLLASKP